MSEAAFPNLPAEQENIFCPMTGEVCAARQSLVKAYAPMALSPEVQAELPLELNPALDKHKLNARLFEYRFRAEKIRCPGMQEGVCPTRQAMNESKVRVGLVRTVRKLMGKA